VSEGGLLRPNLDARLRSVEHPYAGARFVTNDVGFRNLAPIPRTPAPGELRILNLGDSFSAGYEMAQDAFFGARVEARLQSSHPNVRLINSEIGNPAHALYYLQEYGLAYSPQIVLLGICGNDPMQAAQYTRPGGLFRIDDGRRLVPDPDYDPPSDPWARYRADVYPLKAPFSASYLSQHTRQGAFQRALGQFKFARLVREPRWNMPSILYSFLLEDEHRDGHKRLIDGTANLGYYTVKPNAHATEHYERLFDVLGLMNDLLNAAGVRLVVMLFPPKIRVHPEEWDAMREYWGLENEDFDLDRRDRQVRAFCEAKGIGLINPLADLAEAARTSPGRSLYFPLGDIHLSAAGCDVAAASAERALRAELGSGAD
jgi:hypothetical protein